MSNEIRNDIICDSNIDIMDYLVLKLESRQKNLSKYADLFNTIDSYESFYQKRKDIFLLFKNLEEELHQAALAIKALVVQNKSLSHQSSDIKTIQKNYNKLLQENNYLLIENNNYAKKLKEMNNNKYHSPKKAKSPSFKPSPKKNINHNYSNNKKQIKSMKKINSEKRIKRPTNNINKNNIKLKDKKDIGDIYNSDLDLNDVRQLKNVKNIIKEMNHNKDKLKAAIEEHFGRNRTQGNGNYTYYNNN